MNAIEDTHEEEEDGENHNKNNKRGKNGERDDDRKTITDHCLKDDEGTNKPSDDDEKDLITKKGIDQERKYEEEEEEEEEDEGERDEDLMTRTQETQTLPFTFDVVDDEDTKSGGLTVTYNNNNNNNNNSSDPLKEGAAAEYFGHYVVTSKIKKVLLRKDVFAAHRTKQEKDVMICRGEQTRNRGSYKFNSVKTLPIEFKNLGGILESANRADMLEWLSLLKLEGQVDRENNDNDNNNNNNKTNSKKNNKCTPHNNNNNSNNMHEMNTIFQGGFNEENARSDLAYSSAVERVKESRERKMAEKRKREQEEEDAARVTNALAQEEEKEEEKQQRETPRKRAKGKPTKVKPPVFKVAQSAAAKEKINEENLLECHYDAFLNDIIDDHDDEELKQYHIHKLNQLRRGGDFNNNAANGMFDSKFSYDSADECDAAFIDHHDFDLNEGELPIPISRRRYSFYEEINAPLIASSSDMEENPFHKRSGFFLHSRVLNERGYFAIIKTKRVNHVGKPTGHYNYNVSDELRAICEPSWKPPSFKNAADAKAWLEIVLSTTPLSNQELKELEAVSNQGKSICDDPASTVNVALTTTTTTQKTGKKHVKFGCVEDQTSLQASVTWTTQRADNSTVEALKDIARGIVTRLGSKTLPPERAVSALNALKDVDMSLELLELSPIASAVTAIAEDRCTMTSEARQTAKELLESWKEAAQRGVNVLEGKIRGTSSTLRKSGIK